MWLRIALLCSVVKGLVSADVASVFEGSAGLCSAVAEDVVQVYVARHVDLH